MNPWIAGIPSLLMAVATLGWLRRTRQEFSGSDRLEWILGCGLLNAAAFVLWNVLLGPGEALKLWALHAGAAISLNLLRLLMRELQHRQLPLRLIAPLAGSALAAGLTALWTLPLPLTGS